MATIVRVICQQLLTARNMANKLSVVVIDAEQAHMIPLYSKLEQKYFYFTGPEVYESAFNYIKYNIVLQIFYCYHIKYL